MRFLSFAFLLCLTTFLPINAELVCLESLGHSINLDDCSNAMNDLRYTSVLSDFDQRQPHEHTFGTSQLLNRRYRVPQGRLFLDIKFNP